MEMSQIALDVPGDEALGGGHDTRRPANAYGGDTEMAISMKKISDSSRVRSLENAEDTTTAKLGTVNGVFIPTLQNILGIILFLRLPWITGQAGIGHTLVIVLMACLATTLTTLSMSALATNGIPAAGGCYSIIKTSLGQEFGGTVGLLLFLASK